MLCFETPPISALFTSRFSSSASSRVRKKDVSFRTTLFSSPLVSVSLFRMMSSDEPASTPLQTVQASISKAQRQYQQTLDRWTPHVLQRWLTTLGLLALFMLRIVLSQGVGNHLVSWCILGTHPPSVVHWFVTHFNFCCTRGNN